MFGRITAPQQTGDGLFGSTQPQQQSALFGSTQQPQQQQGSGLFGNQQQQTQQGGGLFGGFGATVNQQPQQQQGGSLFGNVGQPAQQQQQSQQPGSVFVQSQGSFYQSENAPRKICLHLSMILYLLMQLFDRTKARTCTDRASILKMESSKSHYSLSNIPLQHCATRAGAFLRPRSTRR